MLSLLSSETAVEQVNDWCASLERQLKDVGNVLEQKLQKEDGGVLGQLDDSMLEKLGLQLVSRGTWQPGGYHCSSMCHGVGRCVVYSASQQLYQCRYCCLMCT